MLLATALLLPALYALSHAALFSGLGASVGASSHAAPLPPALLARCNAASGTASVQGWALLDELQQLRYTRAVLQARRDAALQRQPAAAAFGSGSNSSASGSRESAQPPAAFLFIGGASGGVTWTCGASHCFALALEYYWQVVAARLLPLPTRAYKPPPLLHVTCRGAVGSAQPRGEGCGAQGLAAGRQPHPRHDSPVPGVWR